jgi:hypothetical protein
MFVEVHQEILLDGSCSFENDKRVLLEYSIPRGGEFIQVYLNHGVLREKHILSKDKRASRAQHPSIRQE